MFELFQWKGQSYLATLYAAIFSSTYYGLLHISKIAAGNDPILAVDAHIATNRKKILFILRSSKTHGKNRKP